MDKSIYENFELYNKPASKVNIKNCTIFGMDIETFGLNARNFWFGIISWITSTSRGKKGYYKIFKTHNEMRDFILELAEKAKEKKVKIWMYAHNCEYDYAGIFKGNYFNKDIQYVFKPFIATVKDMCIIDDNMSLYPMSLRMVGEIVGLKKYETPIDMITGEKRDFNETDIKYCLRDTQILLEAIEYYKQTIEEIFGVRIRKLYTSPQVTIKTFQTWMSINRKDFHRPLFIRNALNCTGNYFDFIRLGFRGGRVIAFQRGKFENVVQLDISSMYPFIMKDLQLPDFTQEVHYTNVSTDKAKEVLDKDGIIECRVHVPNIEIGYLPVRYKDQQIYPNQECVIKGIWTTFEIKQAIEKYGYKLVSVDRMLIYEKNYDKYFESYIEKLYHVKQNNPKLKPIAKLLMNSLFGKFAQRNENKQYMTIPREDITKYTDWNLEAHDKDISIVSKTSEYLYPKWTQPYISAIITAKARDYLYQGFLKIDKKDLLYSDTDSIILKNFEKYMHKFTEKVPKFENKTQFVHEWNKNNSFLGAWNIEKWGDGFIRGEKMTKIRDENFGSKISISGVPTMYRTDENFEKGEFTIRVMNKIKGNLSQPERIGTFWDKKINLKSEHSKIDVEQEFAQKELYYEEQYY